MNKLICILLCILLISLSICPIFATDFTYDNRQEFCDALNSVLTFNATSHTSTAYIPDFPTDYDFEGMYDYIVENQGIDESTIVAVLCSYRSNYSIAILTSTVEPTYSVVNNLTSGNQPNMLVNATGSTFNFYQKYSTSSDITHTTSNSNQYNFKSGYTGRAVFGGFIPFPGTFSPNGSDMYILDFSASSIPTSPDNPGYTFDIFAPPPWSASNAFSFQYTPYMYNYYQTLINDPNYDSTDAWQNFREYMAGFANMWEYYQRWYMNCNLRYQSSIYDLLYDRMNNISTISDNIDKLTSVYASDQEIEAREAVADNQQAIVDNFLDSEGDGYVSPSDISSVSSMSDGYKNNMSTDAQPSGIWDIFNSNHFGWFSQETVNQLDTSTSNQRGTNTFETPYLDEKIRDIYRSLGVNYDD